MRLPSVQRPGMSRWNWNTITKTYAAPPRNQHGVRLRILASSCLASGRRHYPTKRVTVKRRTDDARPSATFPPHLPVLRVCQTALTPRGNENGERMSCLRLVCHKPPANVFRLPDDLNCKLSSSDSFESEQEPSGY